MNCLEFHRAKLAAPRESPPEAQAHAAQCAACRAFAQDIDDAERELERSLVVAVPDGLADGVLLRVRPGRASWKPWALAASVLLAITLGGAALLYRPAATENYASQAIEHVAAEPEAFSTLNARDAQSLSELIRVSGGELKAPLGTVRYVRLCPVENRTGLHIVFETPDGLATLLIVPAQPLRGSERATEAGWSALARPTQRGYYAVVTRTAQQTARIDRLVRSRIDWGA